MTQVAIIGGGITGLTAAHHLRKAGISVGLYEASPRAGGVIRSHREGPWLAEGGPNTLLETDPRLPALIDDLGLTSRRRYSDPRADARYVVRDGRPVLLPGSGAAFFVSPLFSVVARLRLLREPFVRRRREQTDESVASFVRRRLGQEFLDYGIDPLVTGIYAGDPSALSIRHAFPRIVALEAEYGSLIRGQIFGARARRRRGDVSKANARKLSFDEGLQVLPDTLCERHRESVRLATSVRELVRAEDGWRVLWEENGVAGESAHRVVLFCGTAHSLARLAIRCPGAPALESLAKVPYPPVTSVVLGFRRSDVTHPCRGFGMLIPHREGFGILGTLFSSSLFPGRAPEGHLTLTTYVGGARRPEMALLADAPLLERVMEDLGRLLGVHGPPVFQHVTRWPHAIPQYNVGYDSVKELLNELESRAPDLHVAGHFRDGVALSDSILTGARVAERIAGRLQQATGAPSASAAAMPTPS